MSLPMETMRVFLLCACFNMFPPLSVGQPAKPSLAKKQQLSASGGVDFHRLNMRPRAEIPKPLSFEHEVPQAQKAVADYGLLSLFSRLGDSQMTFTENCDFMTHSCPSIHATSSLP